MTDFLRAFLHDSHTAISKISSTFSNNFEANASELLENLEEMFSLYYMHYWHVQFFYHILACCPSLKDFNISCNNMYRISTDIGTL